VPSRADLDAPWQQNERGLNRLYGFAMDRPGEHFATIAISTNIGAIPAACEFSLSSTHRASHSRLSWIAQLPLCRPSLVLWLIWPLNLAIDAADTIEKREEHECEKDKAEGEESRFCKLVPARRKRRRGRRTRVDQGPGPGLLVRVPVGVSMISQRQTCGTAIFRDVRLSQNQMFHSAC
jgi:hypothetical protein